MQRGARAGFVVASLIIAAGCSLVVPSSVDRVHCAAEGAIGPPACGAGQVCANGVCTTCIKTDACGDGVDNDCNGVVDDGCKDAGD